MKIRVPLTSRLLCALFLGIALAGISITQLQAEESKSTGLTALSAKTIDGDVLSLQKFNGKVLLIVNTASRCGYTRQYEDLEALYRKYAPRGFEVLAFPSNDFMNQEPGTDAEIKKFCTLKYNVTFPVFSRASVTGDDIQPIYRYLTQQGPREFQGEIGWNFVKFVLDRNGAVRGRFSSSTSPRGDEITALIESLLSEPSK